MLPPPALDPTSVPVLSRPSKNPTRPLTMWSTGEGTLHHWAISLDQLYTVLDDQVRRI